jgi:hypothetical protein
MSGVLDYEAVADHILGMSTLDALEISFPHECPRGSRMSELVSCSGIGQRETRGSISE